MENTLKWTLLTPAPPDTYENFVEQSSCNISIVFQSAILHYGVFIFMFHRKTVLSYTKEEAGYFLCILYE